MSQGPALEISLKLFIVLFQVDEFLIEAVSLKKLDKVRVGHDSTGPGSGWFLDKVVIKDPEESTKEYVFPCNRFGVADFINSLINILNSFRKIIYGDEQVDVARNYVLTKNQILPR